MAVASSETLRSVIDAGRSSKRLDELSSARVIGKIALQAHAAQQKAGAGKSIGPITPGHITLLPTGETKLETSATGSSLGYSAPEQLTGGSGDRRSDVFSLGTVLWEALTYTRLFDAMNDAAVKAAVAEREITAPADINANIPAELSAICMRALARNPADRYSSLKSMAVEIEEFLEEAGYADDDTRIAQFLKSMNLPAVAKPSPMAPAPAPAIAPPAPAVAPVAAQPASTATQPLPLPLVTPATPTPALGAPPKSVTMGWDAMPDPEAAPAPAPAPMPSMTKPVTAPPPTASPVGTKPPPMNAPAPAAPSILTDKPSEPTRAKRASGIDVANALANAGATTTALGVPAAPAPEDWQDKSAPTHPPMPAVQTPMAPVLPAATTVVGKATIAASVAPQVKVATAIEAKHSDPKQTLIGTLLEPKTPAGEPKPATSAATATAKNGVDAAHATPSHPVTTAPVETAPESAVEAKPAEAPSLEAKPAEAKAAAPADDTRTTLVDEKPPAAVVEAAAAEAKSAPKPAGAGAKSEGAPAAPASAAKSTPNPVDAVSLPGRESKADLLAGWGWGTGKHDALPPTGYTDDDDLYEQPNNRKPLIYAIGGGLGIALLITIIAFAAGGSKDKKKPQNSKSTATDTTNDTTARTQPPVEQPAPTPAVSAVEPAVDPAAEKAAAEKAAADKAAADKAVADQAAADKAAADKAAAEKALADKAAAAKAEADAKLLAKQEAAKTEAEKKELAKQEAARKAEQAKQDKLIRDEAAKLAKAEAAAKAEQARLAKQEASKQDAEKKRLAREEAAKQDAEKKRLAKEEAAKRPKAEPTTTVAKKEPKKEPKTEPRKAEKVVAKAEPPKAEGKVDVETAYRIGLQQFARGDTQAALASLRTSLAGNPNYAPTWRGLGLVFEKMGEKAQAKNAYKRYLQLAPTAGDAEIIRGRLDRLGT